MNYPLITAITLLCSASLVYPQEDSASSEITLTIPKLAQLTNLSDFVLGEWSGSGPMEAEQQPCVWINAESYSLVGQSDHGGGAEFRMANPESNFLVYQVAWNDGSGYRTLVPGEKISNLVSDADYNCEGGSTGRPLVKVTVDDSDLLNAGYGNYQDKLTFTVIPE